MNNRHIHIISFQIPYPANYGGVIDVFHKIKALHDIGVKVHLHCFQYDREESEVLQEVCHKVYYYPRSSFYKSFYSYVPFIVSSRKSESLLANLAKDDYPVLFEGLHTCFYLEHPVLNGRVKAVRMHNIEWDYYRNLGKVDRNFFKKFYFYNESRKLKSFENILSEADHIFGISRNDTNYLHEKYDQAVYLPPFHPHSSVESVPGLGKYALYHANLSVVENNQAALFVAIKVFKDLDFPLIICGRNPLGSLVTSVKKIENIELRTDVNDDDIYGLIKNAQMNVLPTFQSTGVKLKLLNALYNGRWCITNETMVKGTGLENLCIVTSTAEEMKRAVENYRLKLFNDQEIEKRKKLLDVQFSNESGAEMIVRKLYSLPIEPTRSHSEESEPEISL